MTPEDDGRKGLFQAGTIAIWVWITVTLVPVLGCVVCCGIGLLGSAADNAAGR